MKIISPGIAASIGASCIFGFIPWYLQFAPAEVSGHGLAAQRIIWSVTIMLLLLCSYKQLSSLRYHLKQFHLWPAYLLAALLVGLQFWLFVWAPVNGETLSVALGYFSLPLVLVMVGRYLYGESLTRLQWLAVGIATIAVFYAYLLADGLSWVVLLVALGYPLYFILRRRIAMPTHIAFSIDNLFLLPIALVYWCFVESSSISAASDLTEAGNLNYLSQLWSWQSIAFYIGLGIVGTTPMLLFLYAAKHLNLSLFGLMSYLEPVLVFIVGLSLGERIELQQFPTYLLIMAALLCLLFDGFKRLSFEAKSPR